MGEEDGRRVEVVEREVTVGDRVDRVAHRVRRRGERQRRAGERSGAERRRSGLRRGEGEARAISLQHLDPREQVVADRHRLGALQVRVAGHRRRRLGSGVVEDRLRELDERGIRLRARVGDVEPERRGDLIVARPAGVDLPPHLAELALDRRVHVLVGVVDLVDRSEPLAYVGELDVVEDPGRMQALGVQLRRLEVVRQQLRIVGAQELPRLRRELAPHTSGPESHSKPRVTTTNPASPAAGARR